MAARWRIAGNLGTSGFRSAWEGSGWLLVSEGCQGPAVVGHRSWTCHETHIGNTDVRDRFGLAFSCGRFE